MMIPKEGNKSKGAALQQGGPGSDVIRVMTYNVHSCIGMDRKLDPERIAKVIVDHQPDIVALQELEMNRRRTGGMNQPHVIAHHLEMFYHFHPSIHVEEEKFGNAILTKCPMELIRSGWLPGPRMGKALGRKERSVMWARVKAKGVRINVFNTHFGLGRPERSRQAEAILGPEWIGHSDCRGPVVLCGDFNALPGSPACRKIGKILENAMLAKTQYTWASVLPMRKIDHIFVSPSLEIKSIKVVRTALGKVASDHLPFYVDIKISR